MSSVAFVPDKQNDHMRLDDQLCFGLYAASRAMTKAYRPYLREIGLTYPQYLVLMALWESDGQTVSELGAALLLDSGTLSPLLKRLEATGLIHKSRQRHDERQVEISVTPKGASLRAGAADARRQIVCTLGMSDRDISVMRQELNGLMDVLSGASSPLETSAGK